MTFTSWQFALFVAVVFVVYYLPVCRNHQVAILIASSLFFYGFGQFELLGLLAVVVLGTYAFLILSSSNRRLWLPIGIAFNLAMLGFFKYKFLFIDPSNFASVDGLPGFLLRLPLPIGISFFVFHNISLLVELSRVQRTPRSLSDVFLYIIFFPQLVSGPITLAQNFLPQIRSKNIEDISVVEATKWIIVGYFFKLYVANNLNVMTLHMGFPYYETVRTADKWLLVLLYSYQIYADFFGYSSIAIGLALLFGYRLPLNFNLPYVAGSFSEFWARWHISLSNWLRTYLYIPLGGNKHGPVRTYMNLMIVMALGGLWHGAGLSYLVWGSLHGIFLIVERPSLQRRTETPRTIFVQRLTGLAHVAVVFFFVSMAWIFFKLPNFSYAIAYIGGMFTQNLTPVPTKFFPAFAIAYSLPVMIQHIPGEWGGFRKRIEPYAYGLMAALTWLEAGPDTSFIYFQF